MFLRRVAPLALLVAAAVLFACTAPGPQPETPTPDATSAADSRTTPLGQRAAHTATPLLDGSVLVAGGCDVDGCSTATGSTFLLTSQGARPMPPLQQPRAGHTATRLADGRVVVIGGWPAEAQSALATAEVFDPADGSWRPTASLNTPRGGHAAAVLGDGRVLVVGGRVGRGTVTAGTEIYDPVTGTFGRGPELPAHADGAVAVELPDGRVLLAGGQLGPDAASGAAVVISADGRAARPVGRLRHARFKHAIVGWADGTVLVVGGTSDDRTLLDSTEIFDPRTSSFTPGPRLAYGRYKLSGGIIRLPDGRVVVAGGGPGAEVIEPGAEAGTAVAGMGSDVASFGTVSVVGPDLWFVGGYDGRVKLTGRDRRLPIAAL